MNSPTSLFPSTDGNDLPANGSSDSIPQIQPELDGNPLSEKGSEPLDGVQFVQQTLADIQAYQAARREASQIAGQRQQQIKRQASNAKLMARMQQFLASGDPILVAEALAWADINPGVLDVPIHLLQDSTCPEGENPGFTDDIG